MSVKVYRRKTCAQVTFLLRECEEESTYVIRFDGPLPGKDQLKRAVLDYATATGLSSQTVFLYVTAAMWEPSYFQGTPVSYTHVVDPFGQIQVTVVEGSYDVYVEEEYVKVAQA